MWTREESLYILLWHNQVAGQKYMSSKSIGRLVPEEREHEWGGIGERVVLMIFMWIKVIDLTVVRHSWVAE